MKSRSLARADPVRVGVVTTSFPVTFNPTSGIFVQRLVSHLPGDLQVTVVTPQPGAPDAPSEVSGYELKFFRYAPRKWMRLTHRPGGIPDALRRRDPGILALPLFVPAMFIACLRLAGRVELLHGNWSVPGLMTALAGRLRRRPSVVTLRGEDVYRAERSLFYRGLLYACLALNHRAVVVSASMQSSLRARYPRWAPRIEFIPNGVGASSERRETTFHSPLRLITVSSLIQRKRLGTIIQSLANPGAASEAVLRIVGDGPERANLESLAQQLGVSHRIEFVGAVAPAEVGTHLAWADVFVFASESEGRPNAVLEAMAAGMPIISTDIPGVRELIHPECGLLYPVGDAEGLATRLEAMSDAPSKALQWGHNAMAKIDRDGLTWQATAGRYAELYREVLQLSEAR